MKKISNIVLYTSIILIFCSCTVTKVMKNEVLSSLISSKIQDNNYILEDDIIIYVDINSQSLFLIKKGQVLKEYIISSSKYGIGSQEGSLKTPLGAHVIKRMIGKDLPKGALLKGRQWSGEIAEIVNDKIDTQYDFVTSRILWLDGLEEGLNRGLGIDSFSRFIYIHGTAEEGLLGQPASNGCIRMYNNDVIELFDLVNNNMKVLIY